MVSECEVGYGTGGRYVQYSAIINVGSRRRRRRERERQKHEWEMAKKWYAVRRSGQPKVG